MQRKISKTQWQQFLEDHFHSPADELGRKFLRVFFPGVEDPDVTEHNDFNIISHNIQDRYVEQE